MNSASYIKQSFVYFLKITRIAIREKAWKFIVFAGITAIIISFVVSENMFNNFEQTKSGFFTLTCACIWLGIFNSVQSICKEHDIIRSEIRQGMKVSSYITANVMWQFLLCFLQSALIFIICGMMGFFANSPEKGLITYAAFEYFITIFLLVFSSSVLGLFVSSVSGNPTTAMTIMPFVLILQLIMCGVLFELTGISDKVSYITLSKWGMSAFGSTADLNELEHMMAQKLPDLSELIADQFPDVPTFTHKLSTLITAWCWCIGISVTSAFLSVIALAVKYRDS